MTNENFSQKFSLRDSKNEYYVNISTRNHLYFFLQALLLSLFLQLRVFFGKKLIDDYVRFVMCGKLTGMGGTAAAIGAFPAAGGCGCGPGAG